MALLGRLAEPRSSGQDRAVRACGLLDAAVRTSSIRSVADAVGVSERTVRSLFVQHVGLSPGTFHQVRRLQRALALSGQWSLAEIAHRSGYSDQAHMCRQVRTLTGLTPGALLTGPPGPRR
jgi:AraC-like DNA-binding protein